MIRINLLPHAERPKSPTRVRGGFFIIIAGLCLLAILGLRWFSVKAQIADLNKENEQLQGELTRYQAIAKEVEKFKADKKNLEAKLASIDRLKAGQIGPVHILDQVSRLLPDGVWLTSLNHSASRLVLQGYSFTNFAIAEFMTQLGKSPDGRFTNVDLSYSEHALIGKVPVEKFEITCAVKL
jgi:type IV pilus assembly protein PilN